MPESMPDSTTDSTSRPTTENYDFPLSTSLKLVNWKPSMSPQSVCDILFCLWIHLPVTTTPIIIITEWPTPAKQPATVGRWADHYWSSSLTPTPPATTLASCLTRSHSCWSFSGLLLNTTLPDRHSLYLPSATTSLHLTLLPVNAVCLKLVTTTILLAATLHLSSDPFPLPSFSSSCLTLFAYKFYWHITASIFSFFTHKLIYYHS